MGEKKKKTTSSSPLPKRRWGNKEKRESKGEKEKGNTLRRRARKTGGPCGQHIQTHELRRKKRRQLKKMYSRCGLTNRLQCA
jgi:hypothetical protein